MPSTENPIEISGGSLPLPYIMLADLKMQANLVDGIYDGIEAHLTSGVATRQLLQTTPPSERRVVTGVHQSPRTERLFTRNPKERVDSPFALAFFLMMKHRFDSLPDLNIIAVQLGKPDIGTVLYPSETGVESKVVMSLNKLFQPKIEVAEMFGLNDANDWTHFFAHTVWAGLCFDTQHSTKLFPGQDLQTIKPEVKRIHVSVGRSDLESHDTPISLDEILKDQRNGILYPLIMSLLDQPNGEQIPLVVETAPTISPNAKEWRSKHQDIAGTLRKWLEKG